MKLNINDYMDCLDELDLSVDQKEQIIRTVWNFMEAEVDKAFGLHPVQQCRGYLQKSNLQSPLVSIDSVVTTQRFNKQNAANDPQRKGVSNGE